MGISNYTLLARRDCLFFHLYHLSRNQFYLCQHDMDICENGESCIYNENNNGVLCI